MRTPDPVIAVVCGDAGGANAVAPVIAQLLGDGRYSVRAFAYRQACEAWARRGLSFDALAEALTTENAASILRESTATFLLTGTSVNGVDLEKRFIQAARSLYIPSLALMDFWSNYALRFTDHTSGAVCLPDWIAVMDDRAREEMIAAGFDANCLVITGQPAFDDVLSFCQQFTPARRATVRAQFNIGLDERMVLFASQPLAILRRDYSVLDLGYTEQSVLGALVAALERIAEYSGKHITLVIRPHPRERASDLESWRSHTIRICVSSEGEARAVALASDLVTGMTTVLLIEACLMGCIVVSLQPGLKLADTLPTNSAGLSQVVYDESQFEPIIEHLLFDEAARKKASSRIGRCGLLPDATLRVTKLIYSIQRGVTGGL